MKDIAAKAGVHQTTVSPALGNHPSLPKKTRDRIQGLAKEMDYQPDPALSALIAYRQSTNHTFTSN
ncbi:MAG: LacI family transcriptional regulator [Candidatus Pelagisphaera sp.]|jgi:LacI family transcriptional regulator